MLSNPLQQITVASDLELINPSYYYRLWLAARNVSKTISRRTWLDELADCFRDYEGEYKYPTGEPYYLPDLDEVFGDDIDGRWLSYYLKADESGARPKSKVRKIERLRIIDLYFRTKYPSISDHLNK